MGWFSLDNLFAKKFPFAKCSVNIKNGEISSNYSFMFSSKKDVENFYNYIYKDAKIYLTRKKEKFKLLPFIN